MTSPAIVHLFISSSKRVREFVKEITVKGLGCHSFDDHNDRVKQIQQYFNRTDCSLGVHRAVTREVVSSSLRPDQHSGSLNN